MTSHDLLSRHSERRKRADESVCYISLLMLLLLLLLPSLLFSSANVSTRTLNASAFPLIAFNSLDAVATDYY